MTTKKEDEFAAGGLREDDHSFKSINILPGFGPASVKVFTTFGFTKASHMIGQFLLFNCDTELMFNWIDSKIPELDKRHKQRMVTALRNWTDNHL